MDKPAAEHEVRIWVSRKGTGEDFIPDESPRSWEYHYRRMAALEELVAENSDIEVLDWGNTKDRTRTHELVDLNLLVHVGQVILNATQDPAIASALEVIRNKLIEMGVEYGTAQVITRIVKILHPKIKAKQFSYADISVKPGGRVSITSNEKGEQFHLYLPNGEMLTIPAEEPKDKS